MARALLEYLFMVLVLLVFLLHLWLLTDETRILFFFKDNNKQLRDCYNTAMPLIVSFSDPTGFIYRTFGFFFAPYKEKYIYFSVIILLRRFTISILVSLIRVDSALSYGLNNIILCTSLIAIFYTRPFKTTVDNNMEIVTGLALIYAYALALSMGIPSLSYGAAAMQVIYFIVNIAVILWCLYELGRASYPHVVPMLRSILGMSTAPPDDVEGSTMQLSDVRPSFSSSTDLGASSTSQGDTT